jgi:hypothetical protein
MRALVPKVAIPKPAPAPATESSKLSVSNCASSLPRFAPSALSHSKLGVRELPRAPALFAESLFPSGVSSKLACSGHRGFLGAHALANVAAG